MPNFQNFKSDVQSLGEQYNKFTVSRTVEVPTDNLWDMEVPFSFPVDEPRANIEVHIYSLADNSLIASNYISSSDQAVTVKRLQYEDATERTLVYIDFAKSILANIQPGVYSVTLNFFVDEIGSYDNRILNVDKISTSRTEIELRLTDLTKQQTLSKFAIPRISKNYVLPALKQIFNQPGADSVSLPMSSVKINSASLYDSFTSGSGEKLIRYNFDDDVGTQLGINTILQRVLDAAYPRAVTRIQALDSSSFTEPELNQIVKTAINDVYSTTVLTDEANNPLKYRFDVT